MLYIITAVHDRYDITYKFVQQIKQQTYNDGIHLILVDDGSSDGTAEMVEREFAEYNHKEELTCTILRGNGNLWWGGSLHLAYKWVRANLKDSKKDYLLISNDDVIWDKNYLQTGINILQEYGADSRVLLFGLGYSINSGELIDKLYYHDYSNKHEDPAHESSDGIGDCCSTRSLYMHVGDMIEIGGFHPVLLPHYGSDYEWTIRASKKGFAIRSDNRLSYKYDEETTGDNYYEKLTIKKLFSKRSAANPFYRIIGIFMMTPVRYIPRELGRQFRRYFRKRAILGDIVKRNRL